ASAPDQGAGGSVPPSTVLVTRASRFIGGQLAARLAADPVIGRESSRQLPSDEAAGSGDQNRGRRHAASRALIRR
ncbi:MAG TPA: hypothetical protein VF788_12010, partial [Pseudonocardiaceae bacterium]